MIRLELGDCVEVLSLIAENSIDAVVTDPPYGLEFMGKEWDRLGDARQPFRGGVQTPDNPYGRTPVRFGGTAGYGGGLSKTGIGDRKTEWVSGRGWNERRCAECGRLSHGGSPCKCDSPRLVPADNRWMLMQDWHAAWGAAVLRVLKPGGHLLSFGGSRTYHRMACAVEDAGFEIRDQIMWIYGSGFPKSKNLQGEMKGWGTALKPAHEPIVVARKPLIGTVEKNVATHGVGALNIDGCRVPSVGGRHRQGEPSQGRVYADVGAVNFAATPGPRGGDPLGRWPANVIHDGSDGVRWLFPECAGQLAESVEDGREQGNRVYGKMKRGGPKHTPRKETDKSAARFFYCAKASRKERGADNKHPTVKPIQLMRYLCRLVTPVGGTVLDPFLGSGTTGIAALAEGFSFIGIERDELYFRIAEGRIKGAEVSSLVRRKR